MAKIKMYVADTIDLVQKWVNENNLDYDSIKLQCHSCDNSTSGAVFTVYGREGNHVNSENANCAIFDVMRFKNFDIEKCKVVGNRILMYEQDLPEMTDEEYNIWFESSEIVDGVRMGKIFIAS